MNAEPWPSAKETLDGVRRRISQAFHEGCSAQYSPLNSPSPIHFPVTVESMGISGAPGRMSAREAMSSRLVVALSAGCGLRSPPSHPFAEDALRFQLRKHVTYGFGGVGKQK